MPARACPALIGLLGGCNEKQEEEMPDFERITDKLREDMARTERHKHEYERGFTAGKSHARKQIAVVVAVLVCAVTLLGMHATWRDCTAAGGQTVRGLFGLECVK